MSAPEGGDPTTPGVRSARFPWLQGRPAHIPAGPGDVPQIVLLPGDPARVDMAAEVLSNFCVLGQNREFRLGVGRLDGVAIGVCSTGIGGPSTEIAVVELAHLGMEIAIRIGGMGAINPAVGLGELLVVTKAMGRSGAAAHYARLDSAVCADPAVVAALQRSAADLGLVHRLGVAATTDSYYLGQGRPVRAGATCVDVAADWLSRGADCLDMETETVLAVAQSLGLSAGAVLAAHNNRATDRWLEDYEPIQRALVRVGASAGRRVLDDRLRQAQER